MTGQAYAMCLICRLAQKLTTNSQKKTVYDCMDDMIELYPSDKKMGANEDKLYHISTIVFASSSHLADILKRRYGQRNITVVNNAISGAFDSTTETLPSEYNKFFEKDKTILTYVGSISSWMDFNLLKAIRDRFPQIKINLWGPPHNVTLPAHSGINLCGTVEHKYLSSILSSSDILIMPFVVNELIESVNPVKLYEYIYTLGNLVWHPNMENQCNLRNMSICMNHTKSVCL